MTWRTRKENMDPWQCSELFRTAVSTASSELPLFFYHVQSTHSPLPLSLLCLPYYYFFWSVLLSSKHLSFLSFTIQCQVRVRISTGHWLYNSEQRQTHFTLTKIKFLPLLHMSLKLFFMIFHFNFWQLWSYSHHQSTTKSLFLLSEPRLYFTGIKH